MFHYKGYTLVTEDNLMWSCRKAKIFQVGIREAFALIDQLVAVKHD